VPSASVRMVTASPATGWWCSIMRPGRQLDEVSPECVKRGIVQGRRVVGRTLRVIRSGGPCALICRSTTEGLGERWASRPIAQWRRPRLRAPEELSIEQMPGVTSAPTWGITHGTSFAHRQRARAEIAGQGFRGRACVPGWPSSRPSTNNPPPASPCPNRVPSS
jgi:hypothetical protein